MATRQIVVIGGSAAGPKAAAKARRMDQDAEITIVQKGPDLSMASCGYPYYVGGFFDDRFALLATPTGVVRDPKFYLNAKGIRALTNTEVLSIDRERHILECRNGQTGEDLALHYDKLILATGARPNLPPVPGIDLKGITTLQSMEDADFLRRIRDDGSVKKAIVVGGGLIGVETCEALQLAGIQITVIEMLPQLLSFLDWQLAKLLENHIRAKAANVITNDAVAEFLGKDGRLTGVKLGSGTELDCELAVIAVGVRANTDLAQAAGLTVGRRGIHVDEHLLTSDPDIYAVGDCVEVKHLITGEYVHAPFGDLANLQGRVAGRNVIEGDTVTFPGTVQSGICKVFDFAAGSTGLSEHAARDAGFEDVVSVVCAALDRPHFMGGRLVILKLVADRATGRILGLQGIGPGDVSKRVAIAATAIQAGMTIGDLVNADLPYAPPFSPAIDPIITTAHCLENKMEGRMDGCSATDVKARLDAKEDMFLLDVRGPSEFEAMRLGVGETLIPLGALRSRLDEMPEDKDKEIICFCKISLRGYEAATFLRANGYNNVKVMEGGLMAWPYPREK